MLVQRIGSQIIGANGGIVVVAPGPCVVRIVDLLEERLDEDALRLSRGNHVAARCENIGPVFVGFIEMVNFDSVHLEELHELNGGEKVVLISGDDEGIRGFVLTKLYILLCFQLDVDITGTDLYQILVFDNSGKIVASEKLNIYANNIRIHEDRLFLIDTYINMRIYEYRFIVD